jgi:hypothetical protein
MLDERYAAELEGLEAHLPGEGEPADEVRDSAEEFIRFIRSDPEWPRLYFEFVIHASRNREFREELATRNRAMRQRIAEVIRNWAADFPAQPPFSYEDLAMMLFCMADGFLIQQMIEPGTDERVYAEMNTTFFRGVASSALELDFEKLGEDYEARSRSTGAGR